jgi:hypothetical protein
MPVKRDPSFIIIAPKGKEYSSISDEDFSQYMNYGDFIEITLQQYAAWTTVADSLTGTVTTTSTVPNSPTITGTRTLRRWTESEPQTILSFPNMAPGLFQARYNTYPDGKAIGFRFSNAEVQEIIDGGPGVDSGTFNEIVQRYPCNGGGSDGNYTVDYFYHRDKFYLGWAKPTYVGGVDQTSTVSPTYLTITFKLGVGGNITRHVEFNLNT